MSCTGNCLLLYHTDGCQFLDLGRVYGFAAGFAAKSGSRSDEFYKAATGHGQLQFAAGREEQRNPLFSAAQLAFPGSRSLSG